MKNSILIVAVLLLFPFATLAQSQSAWYYLGTSVSGDSYFINDSNRTNQGAWFLIWNKHSSSDGVRYSINKQEFDCVNNTIGLRQFATYSASETILFSGSLTYQFEAKEPLPESIGEMMLYAGCNRSDFKKDEDGTKREPIASIHDIVTLMNHLSQSTVSPKQPAQKRKKK